MLVVDCNTSDDWLNDLEYKTLTHLKENMRTAFWSLPQYMIDAYNVRTQKLESLNN